MSVHTDIAMRSCFLIVFAVCTLWCPQAAFSSSNQVEAEGLLLSPPSPRLLAVLKAWEEQDESDLQVELTREDIEPAKLELILNLFLDVQKENFLIRDENIQRLVVGSLFATSQTRETYEVNGINFNKLRLVIDGGADISDIQSYFVNPMRAVTGGGVDSGNDDEGDESITELDSISVEGIAAADRLRALNFSQELGFGESLQGRLLGSTGLATPFNRYNFVYQIESVDGAELIELDPRSGQFKLKSSANFFGEITVNYRVSLFDRLSDTAQLVLQVEPPLKSLVDTYDLRAGRPVDILYVVDNSSGTENQQAQLCESFVEFIEAFGAFNREIQVAAIATSSKTAWTGELLKLPGGESMISSSDEEFVEKVKMLIQPGAENERRQSAILPTNNFFASDQRKAFLREDAFFSMIIISEKDDNYLETGDPDYIMRIYRNTMGVIKAPENMRVDAVVKYGTKTWFGRSKQGEVYAGLAREFGGRVIDITQDFSEDLIEIGYEISRRAQESFDLSFPVYEKSIGTMQVFVGDQPVSRNANDGWVYFPKENRIQLHGEALEDSFGQVVEVFYSTIDKSRMGGSLSAQSQR